jgi:RNA polymerase sigma-70 factor, ECF subfamily
MQDRPFRFARPLARIAAVSTEQTVTPALAAEDAFAAVVRRHRPELYRHCVRLLRSGTDAEDALQDALLRAWRARHGFASGSPRAWLYRIATNACFDLLARRDSTLAPLDDEAASQAAAPSEHRPDAVVLAQETVELTLLTAIQHLPARQHACFVMRDVLSWSAVDSARALSISVAASNSSLQRARHGLRARLAPSRLEWARIPASTSQRDAVRCYVSALASHGVPVC